MDAAISGADPSIVCRVQYRSCARTTLRVRQGESTSETLHSVAVEEVTWLSIDDR